MPIDLNQLADDSTYKDGDQTYVEMHNTVAQAIDPEIFARFDPSELDQDDDWEWLAAKADKVLNALNTKGFLTVGER